MEEIKFGKYVELIYKVQTVDEAGSEVMFEFTKEMPDKFVFGLEQGMVEAFAKNISGLKIGDKFDFILEPADAFGERDDKFVMELDKNIFVVNGKFDSETIKAGNVVPMMDDQGRRMNGIVLEVADSTVTMDFNHPLAGERIQYVGEVALVRDSTEEDRNPSCGCGGCSGCGSKEEGSCSGCNGGCGN